MNAAFTKPPRLRGLAGLRHSAWISAALSLSICGALVWIHLDQRSTLVRSVALVDRFRQSRIDLANGFTHVMLGTDGRAPFDRASGLALLEQAIEEMRAVRQEDPVSKTAADSALPAFDRAADEFRRRLREFANAPGDRAFRETPVRISFAALEREANRLDLEHQRRLRGLQERLDRIFTWFISAAGLLLAGLSLAVHRMVRIHSHSVHALRASQDRLDAVIENLAEGVVLIDDTGEILLWNQAAAHILGFPNRRELAGRLPDLKDEFELLAADGTALPFDHWPINRIRRGETLHNTEVRIRRVTTGWERLLTTNGARIETAEGRRLVFVSFSDITERRHAEDALRLFRRLVDASQDAFEVLDPASGRFLDANTALCTQTGFSRQEILRMQVFEIAPAWSAATWPDAVARIRAAGSVRFEETHRRRDGSLFPVELVASWVELDRSYIVVVVRDISDRRVAEQQLREERDKLVRLAETSPGVVCTFRLGPDGRVSFPYASPKIRDIYGLEPAELAEDGMRAAARWHPDDVARLHASIDESRRHMTPWHDEFRVLHPQRGELWIEGHSVPARESDGAIIWYGVIIDVTDRKRVDRELQDQTRLLQETGSLANVGGWELDPKTGGGCWTPEVARIHDLDPSIRPTAELSLRCYPGAARARLEAALQAAIARGEPYDLELPFISLTGRHKWVRTICRPALAGGAVVRVSGAIQDITDRKSAEIHAEVLHATTQALAESPDLVAGAATILRILCEKLDWDLGELWLPDRVSRRLRQATLWTHLDLTGSGFVERTRTLEFGPGEGVPGRVFQTAGLFWVPDVTASPIFQRPDEARRLGLRGAMGVPVLNRGETTAVIVLFSTGSREPDDAMRATLSSSGAQLGQAIERRKLENQVLQSQKLEAIGTLAGGIAHDFNNVLSAIIGFASIAHLDTADRPGVRECIDDILTAARRATDLVRQILAFSRIQEGTRRAIQLRHIVDEARRLLRASIPSSIEFHASLDPATPAVLADPTQVHQVILNLGTNAAHAMQGATGRLQFLLEPAQVSETFAASHPGLRPGLYAVLSVVDTGHGMNAETLSRIFDPFFTTKAPGEGTGLGLSVVHGIMQRHDGAIVVQSQPGFGTRFDLYFPAHDTGEQPPEPSRGALPRGQGELILCVDDEAPLLRVMQRMLELTGYTVQTETDPRQALRTFSAQPGRYAAAVVDLTMPHMLGTELGRQMRAVRPDTPIILMTGFSGTLTREKAREAGFAELLIKPISMQQMAAVLEGVLRQAPEGG